MEEKKVKFELSKISLIFVILFGLCLLIWTFILGVWVGTKIGGKQSTEEIALEQKVSPHPSPVVNATNMTQEAQKETKKTENETQMNQTVNQTIAQVKEEKKEIAPQPAEKKPEVKKEVTPSKKEVHGEAFQKPEKQSAPTESPKYAKKEVAHLAEKIKEQSSGKFSIQVGAFSQREKALSVVEKAKKLGYSAEIKETTSEGKTLYKVLVGRYGDRPTADKALKEIQGKLGIEKPFVVELP